MYQPKLLLERELAFTKVYRENLNEHRAVRESRCMQTQLKTYFLAPHEEDVIAGRLDRPHIAFAPCFEGDSIDKVCYCIDEASCEALYDKIVADPSYSEDYRKQVREMIDYWKVENTNHKIKERYPEFFRNSMGEDNYFQYNSAIHPLYRLAGINLDMKKLFRLGLVGLRDEALQYAAEAKDPEAKAFYEGVASIQDSIRGVVADYVEEARAMAARAEGTRKEELEKMAARLTHIHDNPPTTMYEAVQLQCIYMLCSRNVELGRIDDYLCEFYRRDLENGTISHEEAVRLLDNFFTIIVQERGRDTRCIIGGLGREHVKSADVFDQLIMDVLEVRKYKFFYPQISLRCYTGMDQAVYDRALAILGSGYTFPMLYNDDVNVPSVMRAMDVPRKVAEQYSFFGCGEYMLAIKSIGTPNTAWNVSKTMEIMLHDGINPHDGLPAGPRAAGLPYRKMSEIHSFEEFMDELENYLSFYADISGKFEELLYDVCNEEACFLQYSCLQDDCMKRGRAMLDGGYYHLGGTVETYGNVTLYDSVNAIREVVFEQKKLSLAELIHILDCNFEGYEEQRKWLQAASKFGNDIDVADTVSQHLHEFICQSIRSQREKTRLDSFLVVIINNNMNVVLGNYVGATPDGRLAETFLSNGNSPYNGQDKEGLPALIHSLTRMDTSIHAGGNQNLKFSKAMFRGDKPLAKEVLATFFAMGGQQVNLSVVDQKDLEDAMVHPERHENLVVRVGGFTARFIDLDKKTQQDVLTRTAY